MSRHTTISMFDDPPAEDEELRQHKVSMFSARQQRAIANYCHSHNVRVELSRYPFVHFTDKDSLETFHLAVDVVEALYDADRKAAANERARQRRMEKRT